MALFFVTALQDSTSALEAAIFARFANSFYRIEPGKWIIDAAGISTSKDLAEALELPETATYFTVPVRGYFGRAQPDLWEWLAVKVAKPRA